jgi:hypothetical protein
MPIRINLLAEAQALEDLRRRDPVKRAIWVAVFLVIAVLVWSSSLQLKAMIANGELSRVESELNVHTNEYVATQEHQKKLTDARQRLQALHTLSTNRFLSGTLLNALQQTTVDEVQLMRCKVEQLYTLNEAVKAKTNANGRMVPGKPASVTERVAVTLEARDNGANPGDQVNKFKQTISDFAYFQTAMGSNEVRLASLSPPQAGVDARAFVLFSLECRYPEKTR